MRRSDVQNSKDELAADIKEALKPEFDCISYIEAKDPERLLGGLNYDFSLVVHVNKFTSKTDQGRLPDAVISVVQDRFPESNPFVRVQVKDF